MKKLIKGLIALGVVIGLLIPSVVSADCYNGWYNVAYFGEGHNWTTERVSSFSGDTAAWDLGLKAGYNCFVTFDGIDYEPRTFWYKVSYPDAEGNWVSEYVKALNGDKAAEAFGFDDASRQCMVNRAIGYQRTLLGEVGV